VGATKTFEGGLTFDLPRTQYFIAKAAT